MQIFTNFFVADWCFCFFCDLLSVSISLMNNFDLKNKIAIVTGGAQGFGLDIAKKFINLVQSKNMG